MWLEYKFKIVTDIEFIESLPFESRSERAANDNDLQGVGLGGGFGGP